MIELPELKPHEGSWMIVRTETGQGVMEIFRSEAKMAEQMNGKAYHAEPIASYLGRLNNAD